MKERRTLKACLLSFKWKFFFLKLILEGVSNDNIALVFLSLFVTTVPWWWVVQYARESTFPHHQVLMVSETCGHVVVQLVQGGIVLHVAVLAPVHADQDRAVLLLLPCREAQI